MASGFHGAAPGRWYFQPVECSTVHIFSSWSSFFLGSILFFKYYVRKSAESKIVEHVLIESKCTARYHWYRVLHGMYEDGKVALRHYHIYVVHISCCTFIVVQIWFVWVCYCWSISIGRDKRCLFIHRVRMKNEANDTYNIQCHFLSQEPIGTTRLLLIFT